MTISARQQLIVIDYFLKENRYYMMLWALLAYILAENIKHPDISLGGEAIVEVALDGTYQDILAFNWKSYISQLHVGEALGGAFFKDHLLPKISSSIRDEEKCLPQLSLLDNKHLESLLRQWKNAKWPYRGPFMEEGGKVMIFMEGRWNDLIGSIGLPSDRRNQKYKKLYAYIWLDLLEYFNKDITSFKYRARFVRMFLPSGVIPFFFVFYTIFVLVIGYLVSLYEGTKAYDAYLKTFLYTLVGLSISFGWIFLTSLSKFNILSHAKAIRKKSVIEVDETDFPPEIYFLEIINGIVESFKPVAREKKPKVKKNAPLPRVSSPVSNETPINKIAVNNSSDNAGNVVVRRVKKLVTELWKTIERPEVKVSAPEKFYYVDASGNRSRVYPFGQVFVAELLPTQIEDSDPSMLRKLEKALQDGRIIPATLLGKPGLKIYGETDEGVAAVLKLDRELRYACTSLRTTVVGSVSGSKTNALVYVPEFWVRKSDSAPLMVPQDRGISVRAR